MATAAASKTRCVTCNKENAIMKCEGCAQSFCYNHMLNHRQELHNQLDEIEVTRDLFKQTLTEQTNDPQKYSLIQQIDKWERDSIRTIQRTAEEERQKILKHTSENNKQI